MVAPPPEEGEILPQFARKKKSSGTNSGGAQEKERQDETEFTTKISSKN